MAKRKEKKVKSAVMKDIPYIRCYAEAGMIETTPGIYTSFLYNINIQDMVVPQERG